MLTLASDFGSPYPAAMRGVVHRSCDARVVDVAHDLPRQDVRAAGFWLRFVLPEFPPSVHCAVVDPGVGTDRDALVVRAGDHLLVGPDNGSLLPPARELAARSGAEPVVYEYDYESPDSTTFHGRDVFAPAAAAAHRLVSGTSGSDAPDDWTPGAVTDLDAVSPADSFVDLTLPDATTDPDAGGVSGEVLVVDDFGNAVTNVPGDAVPDDRDAVSVNGDRVPFVQAFAAVDDGDRLVTVGSHGYVECDVNRGRGDEAFGLGVGDAVVLRW